MATLTIQPSLKDTYLSETSKTTNYGSVIVVHLLDMVSNLWRPILDFDISELPAGITIQSAELSLYYREWLDNDPVGKTVWAYKLSRTDWETLQATWNIYKTGSDWTTPGGDYVTSSPSGGSTTFPAAYGWMTWNVSAIVQDAYANSNLAEFLIRYATEGVASEVRSRANFWSNNYTDDTSLQPKLSITYGATYPTNPLLRASGIRRTFWSGLGGQSVYQCELALGGRSTAYASPIGGRKITSAVAEMEELLEDVKKKGYTYESGIPQDYFTGEYGEAWAQSAGTPGRIEAMRKYRQTNFSSEQLPPELAPGMKNVYDINIQLGGSYVSGVLTPPASWTGSTTEWSRHIRDVAANR